MLSRRSESGLRFSSRRYAAPAWLAAAAVLMAWLGPTNGRSLAVTPDRLSRILEEKGLTVDTNAVQDRLVTLTLEAVDSRGRVLSPAEAESLAHQSSLDTAEEWPEGILYLKLRGLYEGGGQALAQRIGEWSEAEQTGVVLDLRGARGCSLAAVDEMAGLVVPTNTPIYNVCDASNRVVEVRHPSDAPGVRVSAPMVVLVDDGTADASELLAAVLKHRAGVLLIGSTTQGDTGIRELIPLSETEVLYVATRWAVPVRGPRYDAVGVKPDVALSPMRAASPIPPPSAHDRRRSRSGKAERDIALMKHLGDDPALQQAADILLGLKALGVQAASGAAAPRRELISAEPGNSTE